MKNKVIPNHCPLLLSFLGVIGCYVTQAAQGEEDHFYLELGITREKVKVTHLDLTVATVGELYPVIENYLKENAKGEEKEKKKKTIEEYVKGMEKTGLFRSDYDPDDPGRDYRLPTHMKLKKAEVTKGSTLKIFIHYPIIISFHGEGDLYNEAFMVHEPFMDLNQLFNNFQEMIKENHLEDSNNEKIGLAPLLRDDNPFPVKRVRYPGTNESKAVFGSMTLMLKLERYSFYILLWKTEQNRETIKVEGLHCTASLQDLSNYLTKKGFEVEKIGTDVGVFDLKIDGNKMLYEAGFENKNRYDAFGKEPFNFFIHFSEGDWLSSLEFKIRKESTVQELYDILKSVTDQNNLSSPKWISLGGQTIPLTDNTKNVKITDESVGIQHGNHVLVLQEYTAVLPEEEDDEVHSHDDVTNEELTSDDHELEQEDKSINKDSTLQGGGDSQNSLPANNGQGEAGQKKWYTNYFYWLVVGVPIALVLLGGGILLLIKSKVIGVTTSNKADAQYPAI